MHPVAYGPGADQVGDLYLPTVPRAPLVCLFHGGFWRMPYGRAQLHPVAEDLRAAGVAVWNLGYRRIGQGGASWPATLLDVEAALTCLPSIHHAHPQIDPQRLCFVGHSAGGQLAFWAAFKSLRLPQPQRPVAVFGLAPLLDLVAAAAANVGRGAVQAFLGGTPAAVPERYDAASPAALLPLGVQQWVLHGEDDDAVPPSLSQDYVARAAAAGDEVNYVPLPHCGHMALVEPASSAYQAFRHCLLSAV